METGKLKGPITFRHKCTLRKKSTKPVEQYPLEYYWTEKKESEDGFPKRAIRGAISWSVTQLVKLAISKKELLSFVLGLSSIIKVSEMTDLSFFFPINSLRVDHNFLESCLN